jgi:hypothetical protein
LGASSGLESLFQRLQLLLQSLQLLPQCPVVLAKAFDRGFEFDDSRHELPWISAQKIKPLKRSLAQLLAFERQRAVFGLDDCLLAIPKKANPL